MGKSKYYLCHFSKIVPKLEVYKKICLKDKDGYIYAYDIKENTLADIQIRETMNVDLYFRKSSKK